MTKLSVNLNKIATLRNARGGDVPNLLYFAQVVLAEGAFGITVHPRPDERHIKKKDVFDLKNFLDSWASTSPTRQVEFNIEGYPSKDFLELIAAVRPAQATLVPDPPHVITSNAGWDLVKNQNFLTDVCAQICSHGSRVSLFVDPHTWNADQREALSLIKPQRVELYTESFAKAFGTSQQELNLSAYKKVASEILSLNIGLNAGHDLNQQNLGLLIRTIPEIQEVSIGHALIAEALMEGMPTTLKSYLRILNSQGKL